MQIDLWQLPIPDWGLKCPDCEYPLRGLPEHRCPECGVDLDIAEIVTTSTRFRSPRIHAETLPIPDWGLDCPACGSALAGAHSHACPSCARPLETPLLPAPKRPWMRITSDMHPGLTVMQVENMLARELVPYIRSEHKDMLDIYFGAGPLSAKLLAPSEFYYELRWLLRRERERAADEARVAEAGAWLCAGCGEENPGTFECCWNCDEPVGGGD